LRPGDQTARRRTEPDRGRPQALSARHRLARPLRTRAGPAAPRPDPVVADAGVVRDGASGTGRGRLMAKVIMIPGLAVRNYVGAEADALAEDGHDAELLPAPAWRGR